MQHYTRLSPWYCCLLFCQKSEFIYFLYPKVNGTEIEYEFEEITLERVSILRPTVDPSENVLQIVIYEAKKQKINVVRVFFLCKCITNMGFFTKDVSKLFSYVIENK